MPWKKDAEAGADVASASVDQSPVDSSSKRTGESASPAGATYSAPGTEADEQAGQSKAFTPKKGRPTPKRNEVEREVGVRRTAFDAPSTSKEARERRKELKNSMSKDEYLSLIHISEPTRPY